MVCRRGSDGPANSALSPDSPCVVRPRREHHFGFRRVPLGDKQALVDDVFHSVARRYDLMNDLMSGGLHRAWKDALVTAVNPPKGRPGRLTKAMRPSPCSIWPAAPATSPSASPTRAARAPMSRSPTSTPRCSRSAASAPPRRRLRRSTFIEANAEALPLPDQSFDAVTIAFGIRNVPRIERGAGRSLSRAEDRRAVSLPGIFLASTCRGSTGSTSFYSFNVIPALGRAVTGDAEAYRYLVESIRKFPRPEKFADMIARRGLPPRVVRADDRRRGRAAFRLAAVTTPINVFGTARSAGPGIQSRTRDLLLWIRFAPSARRNDRRKRDRRDLPSHASRPRRLRVRARGRAGAADPAPLPWPAQSAIRLARLVERPTSISTEGRLAAALTRLGPTYVKLGQFLATRPDVVGVALARDLE